MSDCIFCKILEGKTEASITYRDDDVTAFMDIQPVNPGHVLVIPNKHVACLSDLDPETGGKLFIRGQKIAETIRKTEIKSEGINFFLADGAAAGQEVFHTHLHVIPRYKGDGFGFKFGENYFKPPTRKDLDIVCNEIKDKMEKK